MHAASTWQLVNKSSKAVLILQDRNNGLLKKDNASHFTGGMSVQDVRGRSSEKC